MAEGRVYVCRWRKLPDGKVRGNIVRPKLQIDAINMDELALELTQAVAAANGDCEPVIEFEPPATKGGKSSWFADGHVSLGSQSHFRIVDVQHLSERGFCTKCKRPIGARTSEELAIESMWPGHASFSWDPKAQGMHLIVVSERFLELLSDEDRKSFELRPVQLPPRARKKFFELVPKHVVAEAPIKSLVKLNWECAVCGRIQYSHSHTLGWCIYPVLREELPATTTFFVGDATHYRLCMKGDRWSEVKAAFRKIDISSNPIAAIDQSDVDVNLMKKSHEAGW